MPRPEPLITHMVVNGAQVTIIDPSTPEERAERLQKPLRDFYIQAQKDIAENMRKEREANERK